MNLKLARDSIFPCRPSPLSLHLSATVPRSRFQKWFDKCWRHRRFWPQILESSLKGVYLQTIQFQTKLKSSLNPRDKGYPNKKKRKRLFFCSGLDTLNSLEIPRNNQSIDRRKWRPKWRRWIWPRAKGRWRLPRWRWTLNRVNEGRRDKRD